METRIWQKENRQNKKDMARHIKRRSACDGHRLTGATRRLLPAIVPTGDESSTNVPHETGGTKS